MIDNGSGMCKAGFAGEDIEKVPFKKRWGAAIIASLLVNLITLSGVIFMVPVVGGAFAEARPTAYDKSGMLCPNLSSGQLKTKYDFEKENQIGDFSPRKGWQGRLAMV